MGGDLLSCVRLTGFGNRVLTGSTGSICIGHAGPTKMRAAQSGSLPTEKRKRLHADQQREYRHLKDDAATTTTTVVQVRNPHVESFL
jgi:hypothetical protein